jgi:alpha,alpha-trehalase
MSDESPPPLEYLTGGDVLDVVHFQSSSLLRRADSKDFVDRPLVPGNTDARRRVLEAAQGGESGESSKCCVDEVLGRAFGEPGSDLEACAPDDWSSSGALEIGGGDDDVENNNKKKNITCRAASDLAKYIHSCWPELCKRCTGDVRSNPGGHTLLLMPNKLFVPGSRFREQYYWDSYFTLQGFLVSGMAESAMQMVGNLLHCVRKYGYVPNGTRSYYLGRTQPPLLSEMLVDLWKWVNKNENENENIPTKFDQVVRNKVNDLVTTSLPLLVKEHAFVTGEHRTVRVRVEVEAEKGHSKGGKKVFEMLRYYAGTSCPRPESHREDKLTVRSRLDEMREKQNRNRNEREGCDDSDGDCRNKREDQQTAEAIYREIATMAESGWDFSSRWLRDPLRLDTAQITRIVPVDLNTIVARMEANISLVARLSHEEATSEAFAAMSRKRFEAIDELLWDEKSCQWKDLWLQPADDEKEEIFSGTLSQDTYASNWLPLWGGGSRQKQKSELAIHSLKASGLVLPGGLATSLQDCGHQWDYPNAWAPLQYLIYQGLTSTGLTSGRDLARTIAERFLRNVYATYTKTGRMHEKYSAVLPGQSGQGGEYEPQTGFGWTNGVVLRLLVKHSECIL